MEAGGAWHFPNQIPEDSIQPVYTYSINDKEEFYLLTFETDHPNQYRRTSKVTHLDNWTVNSWTTVEGNTVSFFHKKSQASNFIDNKNDHKLFVSN